MQLPLELVALILNRTTVREFQAFALVDTHTLSLAKKSARDLLIFKYPGLVKVYNKRYFHHIDYFKGFINLEMGYFSLELALFYAIAGESKDLNGMFRKAATEHNFALIMDLSSQKLVQKFPSIDPGAFQNNLLHTVARLGQKEMFQYLTSCDFIRRFPTINPAAATNSIFQIAVKSNKMDIVECLLYMTDRFPSIDPTDGDSEAIIIAARYGHLKMLKFLLSLQKGPFPHITPISHRNQAIKDAAYFENMDIVYYLLSNEIIQRFPKVLKATRDVNFLSSLIKNREYSLFRKLTSKSYGVLDPLSDHDISALIKSAMIYGSLETIKYLTNTGIPVFCNVRYPLSDMKRLHGSEISHDMADYFVSKGYDPVEVY